MRELVALALDDFASQPFQFTTSATLAADAHAIFAELGDPSLWFPMMRRSIWKTGATSGVDALREVDVLGFGIFRERMLAWDEGERVAFTMVGTTSKLVDKMAEDFRITPEGDGPSSGVPRHLVRLSYSVYAQPTRLGRALTPALRVILRGLFARAAVNLQKRVGSSRRERAKQVS